MTMRAVLILLGLLALAALLPGCGRRAGRAANPVVVVGTELGDIEIEVYLDRAPITAANFMRYVEENRFRGAAFYRTVTPDNQPRNDVKIEVIQGGLGDDPEGLALPAIEHETTRDTGLLHRDGTVSMARAAPGTASSEFFICMGEQPELDFGGRRNPDGQGFAAFGQVLRGMEVVRRIQTQPAEGQMLSPAVRIIRVARLGD